MPSYAITTISKPTFDAILSRYSSTAPEKLRGLDAQRYDAIPTAVAKREGEAYLTKEEVLGLVEWKLKHGTFRPTLLSLVSTNPSPLIESTTKSAFASLPATSPNALLAALKTLTTALKGIGPATASLLLSVASPERVPFFSDELFRWCTWDETGSPDGWKRKIKYNVKEYEALVEKVDELRERLGVRAVDVEKVAWVLGREGVDCDEGEIEEDVEGDAEKEAEVERDLDGEKEKTLRWKRSQPRLVPNARHPPPKPPPEATRKSARTKKVASASLKISYT